MKFVYCIMSNWCMMKACEICKLLLLINVFEFSRVSMINWWNQLCIHVKLTCLCVIIGVWLVSSRIQYSGCEIWALMGLQWWKTVFSRFWSERSRPTWMNFAQWAMSHPTRYVEWGILGSGMCAQRGKSLSREWSPNEL